MPVREPIEFSGSPVEERIDAPRAEVPDGFLDRLTSEIGSDAVRSDEETRLAYGRDWWPLAVVWATQGRVPARPAAVVTPTSTEAVASTVRLCSEAGVPVTAAAGRSGVCGGAIPVAGGVVLDLTGLAEVVDLDETSLLVTVQPGVFGDTFESWLRERGYTLGHWPQSIELSTVGGWVACRSAGQYSTRYGKIEDMVTALEAVTGEGRVLRAGGAPRAAVGPDLVQVLVGSEGTLGVVTEIRLRVHPAPPSEERIVYGFSRFEDGLDACRRILRRGATPAVLRLYDAEESQRNYGVDSMVLIVVDEGDPGLVAATMQVVHEECHDTAGVERLDDRVAEQWLEHRNDVSALPKVVGAGVVVDTVELAGDWATLPRLYAEVCEALRALEGTLVASAHCSHSYLDGGCLYFTFAGRPGDAPEEKDAYYRASIDAVMAAAVSLGAAISHHHGVGLARGAHVPGALGDGAFRVLSGIKQVFDPAGILNPGKLGLPSPFLPAGWSWT